MAEQHPVGFQWVIEAKERGAKVIHVDPRFTRTSAMADLHVPHPRRHRHRVPRRRSINHILENGREFREYVAALHERAGDPQRATFQRHRGPRRPVLAAGSPTTASTTSTSWGYAARRRADGRQARADRRRLRRPGARRARHGARARRAARESTSTLEHPRCVFQMLQPPLRALHAGAGRARSAASRASASSQVAEALCDELGPRAHVGDLLRGRLDAAHDRRAEHPRRVDHPAAARATSAAPAAASSRCAATRTSRARPTSRRSTTSCPSYIPMPHPQTGSDARRVRREERAADRRRGASSDAYIVVAAEGVVGRRRDRGERLLLRLPAAHRRRPLALPDGDCGCSTGRCKGYFVVGPEPGRRLGATRRCSARRSRNLDWLVVRDLRRDRDGGVLARQPGDRDRRARAPRRSAPRSSSCPRPRTPRRTARSRTRSGCCSGTTRRSSRRATAARSCGSPTTSAAASASELAGSTTRRDRAAARPDLGLPDCVGPHDEPDAEAVLQEINGRDGRRVVRRRRTRSSQDDGSTTCGSLDPRRDLRRRRQPDRAAQAAHRAELDRARVGLGVAGQPPHPLQPRLGRPGRDARGRSASATSGGTPRQGSGPALGDDPDFMPDRPPDYEPAGGRRRGWTRSAATTPFIAHPDGLGWLCAPTGLVDGPLPTHYEPHESPVDNPLYSVQRATRRASVFDRPENPYNPPGRRTCSRSSLTTYRLTEHHTAGGMSRTRAVPRRAAARDVLEVSPELAAERGLEHARLGDDRDGARGDRGARAGHRPHPAAARSAGATCTRSALPYHWGRTGLVTGDAANELLPLALDPNVHIREYKALDLRHARRAPPARAGAAALVEDYRATVRTRPRRAAHGTARTRRLLHRHARVHRLQGVRGRVQGVERRPGRRPHGFTGESYDNTVELGADTWRHVAFIEQRKPLEPGDAAAIRSTPAEPTRTATACAG